MATMPPMPISDEITFSSALLPDSSAVLTDAIESLHQACMEKSQDEFLRSAMYHYHRLLQADFVLIGRKSAEKPDAILTDVILHRGVVIPNIMYELKHTPCENVVNRLVCIYPHRVAEIFPRDEFFQMHQISGYVGVPVVDAFGQVRGVLVAVKSTPFIDSALTLNLAKLFAVAVSPYLRG